MKIDCIRTLDGPNVYSYRPVLLMWLDLGNLFERESREFQGFNEKLLTPLPGVKDHHCSLGRPGGFLTRLQEGTYFGHVVEHVALELTTLAGIGQSHGKTRHDSGRIYNVAIEFRAEKASTFLLKQAVELVELLLRGKTFDVQKTVERAKYLVSDADVGPTTRAITEAAKRRGIPCRRDGTGNRIQLGYGKYLHYVQAAMTSQTSAIAVELAQDKEETKDRLERNGIPVPKGKVVYTEATKAADELGRPVVVKPVNGRQGYAVSLEVSTPEEMKVAFQAAKKFSPVVLIEEMLAGRNYRVVIVAGRMVAASERLLPHVVGDGVTSIRDLIAIENRNPLRGDGHEKPLTKIRVDSDVTTHLQHAGMSLDTIPQRGEHITLSNRSNLSTGATAQDVTDKVDPTIAACRALGVEQDILFKSLISFSSWADNPGRANLYRLNGGHVMVDYGHNTEAFHAICCMASNWKDRRVTGIITIPGDRDDVIIDSAARVAAKGFNKVIVREDRDLRGRKPGEVADILCRAIRDVSPATECEVILDEVEALQRAVNRMVKGEVIVHFYEKLPAIQNALQELSAQPVVTLPPAPGRPIPPRAGSRRVGRRLVPATPPA